jgi:hypothetical protein
MINVFDVTPGEKEQNIADMLERGYSFRQIMKQCHVSPVTISNIRKAMLGSRADSSLIQTTKTTEESQAFQLFQQGKSLFDVKIQLDIESSQVIEYHKRYQELKSADMYNEGYEKVKGNITPYLQLFDLMNSLGMTPQQVAERVKCGNSLPQLKTTHSKLVNDIQAAQTKLWNLNSELISRDNKLQVSKHWVEYNNNEYVQMSKQLKALASEIDAKRQFIKHYDNDEGYNRIKNVTADQANMLLRDLRLPIIIIICATIEAIRKSANDGLISHILAFRDNPESYQNSWIHSHWTEILRLAEQVHDEITKEITDVAMGMAVSSTNFMQPDAAT